MTYLSSNQLKQYEDKGFVSPINIFSKDKAKQIRDEIEMIEKEMPGELEKSGRYNAHLISPLLDEVTHNPKILDAVQSLIGQNILVCGTTLFIKNRRLLQKNAIFMKSYILKLKWMIQENKIGNGTVFSQSCVFGCYDVISTFWVCNQACPSSL